MSVTETERPEFIWETNVDLTNESDKTSWETEQKLPNGVVIKHKITNDKSVGIEQLYTIHHQIVLKFSNGRQKQFDTNPTSFAGTYEKVKAHVEDRAKEFAKLFGA